jgi:hypothetical protein
MMLFFCNQVLRHQDGELRSRHLQDDRPVERAQVQFDQAQHHLGIRQRNQIIFSKSIILSFNRIATYL